MTNTEINAVCLREYAPQGNEWVALAKKVYATRQKIKQLTDYERILRDDLIALSQMRNSRGGSFVLQKVERSGSIDYARVPELHNVDLEPYRRGSVTSWLLKKQGK